ncbi:hypothetical protein JAAARDRAFT_40111 [Jaapia argillacea MUCL 33604]|uniref:Extracellular membrane protein CFEM domain-containing protein n=1 Tax=Jaapia argillacea MUCL 33604 TaxID=933084 RepID=A0A067PFA5_9AGAM|nr:hypothetical protein JAAARDRAFT_40111 [Jaapia argillacea MUCL 33604]
MYALKVSAVALLAAASAQASVLAARSPFAPLHALSSRQTTGLNPADLPAQCQTQCAAIVAVLNTCTTISCLCSTTNDQSLANCVDCIYAAGGSTADLQTQAQAILTSYAQECAAGGVTVPTLTVVAAGGVTSTGPITITSVASAVAPSKVTIVTNPAATSPVATFVGGSSTPAGAASPSPSSNGGGSNPFAKSGAGMIKANSGAMLVSLGGALLAGFMVLA